MMNLTLVFRDNARADLDEAADWYKARKPGLEAALVAEVQKIFGEISVHPDRCPVADGRPRFPDSRTAFITGSGGTASR